MIYMWFTSINYYKLAVEKDRDSIFTTIWKPGFKQSRKQVQTHIEAREIFSQHILHARTRCVNCILSLLYTIKISVITVGILHSHR